jgi:hypothetical protein
MICLQHGQPCLIDKVKDKVFQFVVPSRCVTCIFRQITILINTNPLVWTFSVVEKRDRVVMLLLVMVTLFLGKFLNPNGGFFHDNRATLCE